MISSTKIFTYIKQKFSKYDIQEIYKDEDVENLTSIGLLIFNNKIGHKLRIHVHKKKIADIEYSAYVLGSTDIINNNSLEVFTKNMYSTNEIISYIEIIKNNMKYAESTLLKYC